MVPLAPPMDSLLLVASAALLVAPLALVAGPLALPVAPLGARFLALQMGVAAAVSRRVRRP
jgi:hypothetical protein